MTRAHDRTAAGRLALLATAALALGLALQIRDGTFHPAALLLLAITVACTALAIFPRAMPLATPDARFLPLLLAAFVGLELFLVAAFPLGLEMDLPAHGSRFPAACSALAGAAVLGILWPTNWPRARFIHRIATPLFLIVHLLLAAWVVRHAPPGGDVYMFQHNAVVAFLQGHNPWALRFPNIYHPYEGFYGPGLVVRGVLQFGYPYTPIPLFPGLLAWLLGGDLRYAHAVALTVSGALIAYARPGRVASLAAALLLFSPRFGLLLQMAWTEPFVLVLLGATVFSAYRAPRALPLMLGLLFASKQYLVFVLPAAWWWLRDPGRPRAVMRTLAIALAVTAAIIMPFALWDLREFVNSVVTLQFAQPFRRDALSFVALAHRLGGPALSNVSLVAAPLALWLACRRLPRTPAGFGLAIGFCYLIFLAFNKQAFCNYYFFPLAALCLSIATSDERHPVAPEPSLT